MRILAAILTASGILLLLAGMVAFLPLGILSLNKAVDELVGGLQILPGMFLPDSLAFETHVFRMPTQVGLGVFYFVPGVLLTALGVLLSRQQKAKPQRAQRPKNK